MQYGIISDLHSNLEALTAVLDALDEQQVRRIICLGDVVGYNANPNECIELLRDRKIRCVRGNHDAVAAGLQGCDGFPARAATAIAWTRRRITLHNLEWLCQLPVMLDIDEQFAVVHASLWPEPNEHQRIRTALDAQPVLESMPVHCPGRRLLFFGHTHHPGAYTLVDGAARPVEPGQIKLQEGQLYLVNPGSVGQSRDEDPRASYCVYDTQKSAVSFHRVSFDGYGVRTKLYDAELVPRPHLLRRSASWIKHRMLPIQ